MSPEVWTLDQQIAHAQRHAHGIDCCWDCFDGKRVHPRGADDPACEERASEERRCTYAQALP